MKIWFISDTHTRHADLVVPHADVVIHCGDEANVRKPWQNKLQSAAFLDWFVKLDIATKIFVPGNHSTAIADGLIKPVDYPSVRFLIHEAMELHGLRLFGSPYTPEFFDWAYMKDREELEHYWAEIPAETDILLTHGPPKGIRDVTRHWRSKEPIHVGSKKLTRHVTERIKPRIHAFGHLHDEAGIENFGAETRDGIQFINCSCVDLQGNLVNHGLVVELA
jgi:Icc-related predicted phosphoesterase